MVCHVTRILVGLTITAVLAVGFPTRSYSAETEQVLFAENFSDDLDKKWTWVRESPKNWKLDKQKQELHIQAMPGVSLFNERTLTNILLRDPPSTNGEPFAFSVHLHHRPLHPFETGGMICYFDDDNVLQFNKELMDGKLWLIVGRKQDGKSGSFAKKVPYENDDVELRMVVAGKNVEAQYRATADEKWQTLAATDLPRDGQPRIGLRAGYGPKDRENWARFSRFRVVQLLK